MSPRRTTGQQSTGSQRTKRVHHSNYSAELAAEQSYVDALFGILDSDVSQARQRLADAQLTIDPANADSDALLRRETEYHRLQEKLDQLNLAQIGLVFGRIDVDAKGENPTSEGLDRRYIGRIGLMDRDDDYRSLLIDWRAPMARPFYLATTAHPEGVRVRRHIRTADRVVKDIDDELLSGTAPADADRADVAGEAALLHAMNSARGEHMESIVETIQREQDAIIRDSTRGVLVVEGGPGTGKTAVALHRVAYLLYTWREQLSRTGVLIIGPNPTFLNYISQVLPELGETGVVLSTIGRLYPGLRPTLHDTADTRRVKGSLQMVDVLKAAVKAYQHVPKHSREVVLEGTRVELTPTMVKTARTKARRSRKPHNEAREIFSDQLQELLAQGLAEIIGHDPLDGGNLLNSADISALHEDISDEAIVDELVDEFWPQLGPRQVLRELLSDREKLHAACRGNGGEEFASALWRSEQGWSDSDAALLDELAQLLGSGDDEQQAAADEQEWREALEEAEGALDILATSESTDNDDVFDSEILSAHHVIDAETLARRQQARDYRTTAERAEGDRTWAFGHVVVDEAQELSAMEWRMVFRRSPNRWMTVVGDPAQTGSPAGCDSWSEALEPFVGKRYRQHQLTINYRTPVEIAELAESIVHKYSPDTAVAQAIRNRKGAVRWLPSGTSAEEVRDQLRADETAASAEDDTADQNQRSYAIISAHNAATYKGLEFDHVIVVEPEQIIAASSRGWQDLYVACTRATQTLSIIGTLDLAGWN